jgi:Cu-Zn family superoxide dismutase
LTHTEFHLSRKKDFMRRVFIASFALLSVSACAWLQPGPSALAQLTATKGNTVNGFVKFVRTGDAVVISGEVQGLAPNSEHGFHIHEKGDCSSGDGLSAGGHFNPAGKAHGSHDSSEHHAGDLASLKADANGVARFSYASTAVSVGSGSADVIGRGLIVHRDADDFKTQPTGNSGPRLACGVITAA